MLLNSPEVGAGRTPKASVLKNSDFVRLWVAQAISQTAQNAVFYALLVFVEQQTSSSLQMGILVVSTLLPFAFFGVAAGALVDRWPKKHVLAISNAVRVPIVLLYVVVDQSLAAVYALNLVFSTVAQFFSPAEAAAIPLVVRREQLFQANGMFNLTLVISQLAGFVVLGPPLVKLFGVDGLFFFIAAAYALATLLVATVPIKETLDSRAHPGLGADLVRNVYEEIREGWRLIRSDTGIGMAMMQLTVLQNISLAAGMIAPGLTSRVLYMPAADAVFVLAPAGIGILLGTIVVPRLEHKVPRDHLVRTGLVLLAATLLIVAAAPSIYGWVTHLFYRAYDPTSNAYVSGLVGIVMLATHIMGWAFAMVVVPAQTVLQIRAPANMRGRVFAVQLTFANVVSVIPLLFLAALADLVGITRVLALIGAVVLLAWYVTVNRSRELSLAHAAIEQPAPGQEV